MDFVLAIDQGTTSTRAMVFDATGSVVAADILDELRRNWSEGRRWQPQMEAKERERTYRNWKKAVTKTFDRVDENVT